MLFSTTAPLLNTQSTLLWEWQNTEYFEIPYDKWRIFCKPLNVYIRFSEDIMNASVMFHHFLHEIEYCDSDPYIIPFGVVTFHSNYASNICHHSSSYFYSGVLDTPRQYHNIRDVIISHIHMHLCNTHPQCFHLLFQLSPLCPVKSQLLQMLLYFAIHLFLRPLLQ